MANSTKLTPRLEVITEFAKGCKNAADIGCEKAGTKRGCARKDRLLLQRRIGKHY